MNSAASETTASRPNAHSWRNFLTALSLGGLGLAATRLNAETSPSPPPTTTKHPAPATATPVAMPPPLRISRAVPVIPAMASVVTSDTLGTTLMHEHLLHGKNPPDKREATIALALQWLGDASRVGINTIVDLSPLRDIVLCAEIARRSPAQIIASTGAYLQKVMPPEILALNESQRKASMLREGIDGTGIRAGIINVACNEHELSDWDQRVYPLRRPNKPRHRDPHWHPCRALTAGAICTIS